MTSLADRFELDLYRNRARSLHETLPVAGFQTILRVPVIAQKLASMGADIVSIDLDSSDETITAVEKLGGKASSYIADLTNEERVNKVFAGIIQEYQGIDMLINNAGFYSVERRPFWEIGLDEWEKVMTINVRSVFLCSRAVAKTMRDAGSGCIVNISSSAIAFGMPNLMHYVAAKSAVIGMTPGD